MPTLSNRYFTNITQQSVASGHVWSNLDGMKQEADEATSFFNSGFPSYIVRAEGMTYGALPSEIQITQIQIQIAAYYSGGGAGVGVNLGFVGIEGGLLDKDSNNLSDSQTTKQWSGSPAFWGLTDQQALEFVQGTRYVQFQGLENGSSINFTLSVPWVRCTFTYRPLGVTMPCIF